MTQTDRPEPDDLERMLGQAAQEPRQVPPELMARVIADGARLQPSPKFAPSIPRQSWGARVVSALGGWPTMSGLAAASCAGFWIGYAPPEGMLDASESLLIGLDTTVYEDAAELTGFGWDLEEG